MSGQAVESPKSGNALGPRSNVICGLFTSNSAILSLLVGKVYPGPGRFEEILSTSSLIILHRWSVYARISWRVAQCHVRLRRSEIFRPTG